MPERLVGLRVEPEAFPASGFLVNHIGRNSGFQRLFAGILAGWSDTQVGWINAARSLTLVPSTGFGWEHYPSGLWVETKPQNIFDAPVELPFTSHRGHC